MSWYVAGPFAEDYVSSFDSEKGNDKVWLGKVEKKGAQLVPQSGLGRQVANKGAQLAFVKNPAFEANGFFHCETVNAIP